jgi:hypothetical protein
MRRSGVRLPKAAPQNGQVRDPTWHSRVSQLTTLWHESWHVGLTFAPWRGVRSRLCGRASVLASMPARTPSRAGRRTCAARHDGIGARRRPTRSAWWRESKPISDRTRTPRSECCWTAGWRSSPRTEHRRDHGRLRSPSPSREHRPVWLRLTLEPATLRSVRSRHPRAQLVKQRPVDLVVVVATRCFRRRRCCGGGNRRGCRPGGLARAWCGIRSDRHAGRSEAKVAAIGGTVLKVHDVEGLL